MRIPPALREKRVFQRRMRVNLELRTGREAPLTCLQSQFLTSKAHPIVDFRCDCPEALSFSIDSTGIMVYNPDIEDKHDPFEKALPSKYHSIQP